MNQQAIDHFCQHYIRLSDEELEALDARKTTLLEEAQIALASVLAERGVSVDEIRRVNAAEDEERAKAARDAVRRRGIRDAKLTKWFFIISVPVIVLSILLQPEKAWQTLVSSTVQALGIFVIVWIALLVKRKLSSVSSGSNADDD